MELKTVERLIVGAMSVHPGQRDKKSKGQQGKGKQTGSIRNSQFQHRMGVMRESGGRRLCATHKAYVQSNTQEESLLLS